MTEPQNNVHQAEIIALSEDDEEEVTLRIGEETIVAFATVCPYEIFKGKTYTVEIAPFYSGNFLVEKIESSKPELIRGERPFEYIVRGRLNADTIESTIHIHDPDFAAFQNLQGTFVETIVDRLDATFL